MSSRDALLRAIRVANLLNGLAHRRHSPRIARHAVRWSERVNELYEAVHPQERIDVRLPDFGDRRIPAYSVEYPRYFPIRIIVTRDDGPVPSSAEALAAMKRRSEWLLAILERTKTMWGR